MRAARLVALAALLAAGSAGAGDVGKPGGAAHEQARELERFRQRRALEAGAELRGQARDAERRAEERRLEREGTSAELEAYRRRARAEEATDELRLRHQAAPLSARGPVPAEWWRGLGPETRRVLIESGIARRRAERLHELDARTRDIERTIERREHPPPGLAP